MESLSLNGLAAYSSMRWSWRSQTQISPAGPQQQPADTGNVASPAPSSASDTSGSSGSASSQTRSAEDEKIMAEKIKGYVLEYKAWQALQRVNAGLSAEPPPPTAWELAQQDAQDRAATIIGAVMAANAKFHIIEENPHLKSDDSTNIWIRLDNSRAEGNSFYGVLSMGTALSHAGVGNVVTQKETGEYKLHAFKITSNDGKLVSELTEDGRYIDYNEDGSVHNTLSRDDTSKLSRNSQEYRDMTGYARLALEDPEKYSGTEFF